MFELMPLFCTSTAVLCINCHRLQDTTKQLFPLLASVYAFRFVGTISLMASHDYRTRNSQTMSMDGEIVSLLSPSPVESDVTQIKEKHCRYCREGFNLNNQANGPNFELGCACKDEMGDVHMQCAKKWFIKRNERTCEICGSEARNMVSPTETELLEHFDDISDLESISLSVDVSSISPERCPFCSVNRVFFLLIFCLATLFVLAWTPH